MNKKSEAQVFLEGVEKLDALIESKRIEKIQWEELAMKMTADLNGERIQSQSSKSKMADAVEKCFAIADEVAEAIDQLIADKKKVIRVIEKLYSPTEYKLLHMRYIRYMDLKDIAKFFGKDYSWATTTHGRALKNVQNILTAER